MACVNATQFTESAGDLPSLDRKPGNSCDQGIGIRQIAGIHLDGFARLTPVRQAVRQVDDTSQTTRILLQKRQLAALIRDHSLVG